MNLSPGLICLIVTLSLQSVLAAQYSTTHSFVPSTGYGGWLTANGNTLYGTTYMGGSSGAGTIFQTSLNGSGYKVLLNFDIFNGGFPSQQPVVFGDILYGIGSQAGDSGSGTLWAFNLTSSTIKTLFSFTPTSGTTSQAPPIITKDGTTLYGITGQSGAFGAGTLWSFVVESATFTVLHNFRNGTTDGQTPFDAPLLSLDENILYGVCFAGGVNGIGTIFQFNLVDSEYSTIYSFESEAGARPQMGSLIWNQDYSKLLGMAWGGGAFANGTIFSFDTQTPSTSTSALAVLHSFSTSTGSLPYGALTLSPDGNSVYGLTWKGGPKNMGVIFALNLKTNAYRVLRAFQGGLRDGGSPFGSVVFVENRVIMGTTTVGGQFGGGTIFRLSL